MARRKTTTKPSPGSDELPKKSKTSLKSDAISFLPDAINTLTRQLNEVTLDDLRRFGMTVPRWSVLAQLAVRDGRSIGDLARATVIKQSSLTRVVDQMERDGLVERRAGENDSRYIEVWITETGLATYDKVVPLALQRAHQAFEGFRDTEVETFQSLVQRLLDNVRGSNR